MSVVQATKHARHTIWQPSGIPDAALHHPALPGRCSMTPEAEWRLGQGLHDAGFWYLPDIGRDAELVGTQFWRIKRPYVELFQLSPNGLALASRSWAVFEYDRPTVHGAVTDARRGQAANMLDWLIELPP